jgi:ABC-2 type transport system ATP-binding protein
MASALIVNHLRKDYAHIHAVDDVSFEVNEGEIFGLIGPNGAGKTTTLEIVLGLTSYDQGSICIFGNDLSKNPNEAKELIGAQLQNSQLPDVMTPRQALILCASFYKDSVPADELIERFQLKEKANSNFDSLSGGQKQRLSLALAFVNKPKLVILDEPTAGLDPQSRKELHALITEQRSHGVTIVFTTHFLEEARTLCDRIAFIKNGSIIGLGSPESLIEQSALNTKIKVRASRVITEEVLLLLPFVISVKSISGFENLIETTSVNKTLSALTSYLDSAGIELHDLQINRPTLDDAFAYLVSSVN